MKIPGNIRWKATGRTLGEGGQASVVEVTDTLGELEGTYALKSLSPRKPPQAYDRFAREVEALKAVMHPAIIQIVDHSLSDAEFHFYVMEYHEGAKPLNKVIGTESSPYHRNALASLSLFEQLLSGIEACEKVKIVHRDLNPANVLLLPDGQVKIIDFGICQIEEAEPITLIDETVGTRKYTAPECESGENGPITSAADFYSAGKILWSAVTNLRAFSREAPVSGPKSMQTMFPDAPQLWDLQHVFTKTICHDPGARWQTVAEALQGVGYIRQLLSPPRRRV